MLNRRLLKVMVTSLSLLTLIACSSNTKMAANEGAEGIGEGGALASGLGEPASIAGYRTDRAYRLSINNQIYFFDFDKSDVHPEYLPSIDAQANYLVTHPRAHVLLTGNTDERGSREYNIALGNRRALSVADRLKVDGVKPSQIRVVSYGPEKPVAQGNDEQAYAYNRNVQLIYESK